MRVIVPMAGAGDRFVRAGYPDPKPLIPLLDAQGGRKRIIEHVVGMFDPSDDFVFVCNFPHLRDTRMAEVILVLCPKAQVVGMPAHKRGPVYTVMAAAGHVPDDEPVIVSYCDGAIQWDRAEFDEYVRDEQLDGCLLTHTGFHPHVLSTTRMAFVRTEGGLVVEVREKASFTDDPLSEHASSGVYYFRTGAMLKHYFQRSLDEGVSYNGEHYVTLVYNPMIQDGLRVGYFDTPGVAILGTPGEVSNYEAWQTILRGEQVKSEADAVKAYRYWSDFHARRVGEVPHEVKTAHLSPAPH